VIDQSFQRHWRVAIAVDIHVIEPFPSKRAGRMRPDHSNVKLFGKPSRQFMHETWLGIACPARIGRGKYEQPWPLAMADLLSHSGGR